MSPPQGYLQLVLHAHLPYVRHREYDDFLEERWLFEAVSECYLPMLRMLERLAEEEVPGRLTVSLSPTLLSMLSDPLLQARIGLYLEKQADLADRECRRTRGQEKVLGLAMMYRDRFRRNVRDFERRGGNLVTGFTALADAGLLDLWTTAATHGFLPILRQDGFSVEAQTAIGRHTFEAITGRQAAGFWLPECGYYPGLEGTLLKQGFHVSVLESHGILHARPKPYWATYAPLACPDGYVMFGRDAESSRQVWDAHTGYPGDPLYREYYRDIGFHLEEQHLRDFLVDGEVRSPTGIKYHRVTGPEEEKELYHPAHAVERTGIHAAHFLDRCRDRFREVKDNLDRPPVVTAPFDMELFGHWWYEGASFLDEIFRRSAAMPEIELLTPGDYVQRHPVIQKATPSPSTWGEQGYHGVWMDPSNDWIIPHLFKASAAFKTAHRTCTERQWPLETKRIMNQALRELLLLQSSDWPFMMKTGSAVPYAEKRIRDHLGRLYWLLDAAASHSHEDAMLRALELLDPVFPDVDAASISTGG